MTQLQIINFALSKLGEPPITAVDAVTPAARKANAIYQTVLDDMVRRNRWGFARDTAVWEPAWVEMDDLVESLDGEVQIEEAAHGRTTGDRVTIKDTGIEGTFTITVVDADNFSLDDTTFLASYVPGSYTIAPPHTWAYRIGIPLSCLKIRSVNGYEADRANTFFVRNGSYLYTNCDEVDVVFSKKQTAGTDESGFDPCFNNVFACRLAMELAMPVTGSMNRRNEMKGLLDVEMMDARRANAYEPNAQLPDRTQGATSVMAREYDA